MAMRRKGGGEGGADVKGVGVGVADIMISSFFVEEDGEWLRELQGIEIRSNRGVGPRERERSVGALVIDQGLNLTLTRSDRFFFSVFLFLATF